MKKALAILLFFLSLQSKSQSWDWLVQEGGYGYDWGYDITVDDAGNIYTTGIFDGTQNFGTTTLYTQGGIDIYISKF